MPKNTIETSADLFKAMSQFYTASLKQPDKLLKAYGDLFQNTMASLAGTSDVMPPKGDKRFMDPIWTSNPAYKAMMQTYLTWSNGLNDWVEGLEIKGRDKLRAQILTSMLTDSVAPTNMLLGNPSAMKMTLEKGGKNLVDGAKHFIDDMVNNNGLPSMVDKSKFGVGENLGTSEGEVVYRAEMLELIQYKPTTEKVFKRPIFIVPPQINKFYIWDLAPNRSVIEYLLNKGHQIFIVSWRNPGADHADWGMDAYVDALDSASAVACEISKSKDLNLIGACSGGITTALLLSYWAAKGIDRANSLTLLVAVLDIEGAKNTTMGLFANVETLELARMFTRSKGILPGKDLQKAFAWLRPNDLIWAYWVNNYLLGNEPPAFDILFWNADTTNLPSAFHTDMLDMLQKGGAREGADIEVLGTKMDLRAVDCDKFVVGGTTDHITPWDGCYLSMQAFGGNNEFVLSQSGHIQAIVNPPGNPKAKFLTNTSEHATTDEFLDGSEEHQGTWWDYWAIWLEERAGTQIKAPKSLGSKEFKPLAPAPGTYVHENA
ncbi:PHA/PHB synthase family protein [Pukyongiella litopenaei]|uniref:Alpha/beta fold hydrolase n=1 Tax=Pukyongiella litopenaei TaxID=2605946 RepID=A0A5C2H8B8_9RHOB|nr:alpha/beta fold hydrolase [Pukyongiella litopenaei]QEP30601.1 alpha/beta fold hydrolase [Pukyongiella litopenaei]